MNFDICKKCFAGKIKKVRVNESPSGRLHFVFLGGYKYACPAFTVIGCWDTYRQPFRDKLVADGTVTLLPKEVFDNIRLRLGNKLKTREQVDMTPKFFQDEILSLLSGFTLVPKACHYYMEHMLHDWNAC